MSERAARVREQGGLWPTPLQELLLRAGLLRGEAAHAAWRTWLGQARSAPLDRGSHRLLPLILHNLSAQGGSIPQRSLLEGAHEHFRERNEEVMQVAREAVQALSAADIPTIALKGVSLCVRSYPNAGTRPMSDADLLVPLDRAAEAVQALVGVGFVAKRTRPVRFDYEHAVPMVRELQPSVDLHWMVFGPKHQSLPEVDFWSRRVPLDLGGVETSALSTADELLHLIVHGLVWDRTPPLRWIADAALLARRSSEPIRWDLLLSEGLRRGLSLPLRDGLAYLHHRLGEPVPREVMEALSAAPTRRLQRLEYWCKRRALPSLIRSPFHYARAARFGGERPGAVGYLRYLYYVLDLDGPGRAAGQIADKLRAWR